jgi:predicted Rossmann-fold nucleotide-binding protein
MGTDFWQHLRHFLQDGLIAAGTIGPGDLDWIRSTDSVEEALRLIRAGKNQRLGRGV